MPFWIVLITTTHCILATCLGVHYIIVWNAAGCFMTVQSTVLSDLVGVKNIARAQAFLLLFIGIGALISVPLAGAFFLSYWLCQVTMYHVFCWFKISCLYSLLSACEDYDSPTLVYSTLRSPIIWAALDDCLEYKWENYQNCSVLCCVQQLCTMICTHMWALREDECWFSFWAILSYHCLSCLWRCIVAKRLDGLGYHLVWR